MVDRIPNLSLHPRLSRGDIAVVLFLILVAIIFGFGAPLLIGEG